MPVAGWEAVAQSAATQVPEEQLAVVRHFAEWNAVAVVVQEMLVEGVTAGVQQPVGALVAVVVWLAAPGRAAAGALAVVEGRVVSET